MKTTHDRRPAGSTAKTERLEPTANAEARNSEIHMIMKSFQRSEKIQESMNGSQGTRFEANTISKFCGQPMLPRRLRMKLIMMYSNIDIVSVKLN